MVVVGKEKETWMKLTTKPLDNEKNYRKVKKAFCSLPQIKDQVYQTNETVTIKVVCCSPEKVADKLCQKGGGAIKKIEYGTIDNPLPKSSGGEKPKEADKSKQAEKPKADEKPKVAEKPKEAEKPKPAQPAQPASSSQTMTYYPGPPVGHPMYGGSHEGYYPWPPVHEPRYNGYPSRPIYDSWGGGGWYGSEESSHTSSCTIM